VSNAPPEPFAGPCGRARGAGEGTAEAICESQRVVTPVGASGGGAPAEFEQARRKLAILISSELSATRAEAGGEGLRRGRSLIICRKKARSRKEITEISADVSCWEHWWNERSVWLLGDSNKRI